MNAIRKIFIIVICLFGFSMIGVGAENSSIGLTLLGSLCFLAGAGIYLFKFI